MQIYRPGMGKFSSQTITGKSDEGSEFATEFAGGNSADESKSDSKQPDGNTGKKFTNFIFNNLGIFSSNGNHRQIHNVQFWGIFAQKYYSCKKRLVYYQNYH